MKIYLFSTPQEETVWGKGAAATPWTLNSIQTSSSTQQIGPPTFSLPPPPSPPLSVPLHLAPLLGPVIRFIYLFFSGPSMWGGGSKGAECVAAPSLFTPSFDRGVCAPTVALCDFTLRPFD